MNQQIGQGIPFFNPPIGHTHVREYDQHNQAGLLTFGSTYSPRLPILI